MSNCFKKYLLITIFLGLIPVIYAMETENDPNKILEQKLKIITKSGNFQLQPQDFVDFQNLIIRGADSNTIPSCEYMSLFTLGFINNNLDFLIFLLNNGFQLDKPHKSYGSTPLHTILSGEIQRSKKPLPPSAEDQIKILKVLINKFKADVNIKENDHYSHHTLLDFAKNYNAPQEVVNFLRKKGAKTANELDHPENGPEIFNRTTFYCHAHGNWHKIGYFCHDNHILFSHNRKISPSNRLRQVINQRKNNVFRPEDFREMKKFINEGADPKTTFKQWGERISLLTLGIINDNTDFVKFLLSHGVDPNIPDDNSSEKKETPFNRMKYKVFLSKRVDENQKEMESLIKSASLNENKKTISHIKSIMNPNLTIFGGENFQHYLAAINNNKEFLAKKRVIMEPNNSSDIM